MTASDPEEGNVTLSLIWGRQRPCSSSTDPDTVAQQHGQSKVLSFKAKPDFEMSEDTRTMNNIYEVTVEASDGVKHRHAVRDRQGDRR